MSTVFGVHTGPANTTFEQLRDLWHRIESGPFDWISIWDHFYAADERSTTNLEAVAIHTALAMSTTRVRCGSLVYCAGYRHPAVLANAMATIDQISNGRCEFGIGAGWAVSEYRAYGIDFDSDGRRLDHMEESLRCVQALLHRGGPEGAGVSFEGRHFRLTDAFCDPSPVQSHLPLWVGGAGEKRTLRIAAELADGWNIPFVSPEVFAHKRSVLERHCDVLGRDVNEIRCAVNVACAADEAALEGQFGALAPMVEPGAVLGSREQMTERIGRFVEAGADQINLALRAPFDDAALDVASDAIASMQ